MEGLVPEEIEGTKVVEGRSASDYEKALDTVLAIAEGVLLVAPVPQAKVAGAAIGVAKKAVGFAREHHEEILGVAPLAAPAASKMADAAKSAMEKAPSGVGRGMDKFFGAAKNAAGAVGDAATQAKDAVGGRVRSASDKRAQEKARKEARRTLLDGAGTRMPVDRFLENWKLQKAVSGKEDYLDFAGCYAVATYGRAVKKDDYSEYRDIYVSKSNHMGRSILGDLIGEGNPDVYADVKYKQDVYVLLFPCTDGRLDQLKDSLVVALDADASYNKTRAFDEEGTSIHFEDSVDPS